MTFDQSDFTTSAKYSDLVNRVVFEDGHFHPNLGGITTGGGANHFPMVVLSLAEPGAADNHITRFIRSWPRYRARIDDMGLKDKNILTLDNWHEFLGRASFLVEFRRVFLTGLKQQGVTKFTVQALHKMTNGLPIGLFHPLNRLSFARMHGDLGIIADAIAYFAIRYQDLYLTNVDNIPASIDAMKEPIMIWQTLSFSHSIGNIWITYEGASLSTCEKLCSDSDLHE